MNGITKRDVKVFVLGMLVMFLIVAIIEWRDTVRGFKDGLQNTQNK